MNIFQKEIDDGIGELVKSTASIAYCSPVTVRNTTPEAVCQFVHDPDVLAKVLAENKDQRDLFYLEAVLVSTGWNKNDDVFTKAETWAARNTPEDKQFNFMHDENDIIGHITSSYVVTNDGQNVSSDGEAPEEFDIITQAVLYNSWTQAKNQQRMQQIIDEIPEGKWFVSMECLFAGFDYALIDEKGEAKVLARDEASAFLTKHLRAYGGTGEYEGYKLGRALSNISFSGKGLVSKPANPRSVILNSSTASFNIENPDSKLSIGEISMSDSTVVEKQLAETKAELAKALSEVEAVKAQIAEAKDKEFATKIEVFEADAKVAKEAIANLEAEVEQQKKSISDTEAQLAEANDKLAEAEKHMDEMKKKEKEEKRKAALVEAGLEEEEVVETLASFEALDDEAFETIAGMMKKKAMKKYGKDDDKKDKEAEAMSQEVKDVQADEAEAEEATDVLDEIETSEASLVVSEGSDETETAQASVAEWFGKHVLSNSSK
jgi:chemotaxis protein histidine kinase CheA